MNSTLQLIERRTSTRAYAPTPITSAEKDAILNAAFRAPTAGNMMLYSIIDVTDQALKDRLAVTCDDQPFIAKAPLVLIFLADFQKWIDLFDRVAGDEPARAPGMGDLLLACSDARIAAHNAPVPAQSLGIGSCYIGDILENGETHAELLDLPPYTLPIAMLCFGRPASPRDVVPRYTRGVIHENRYVRPDDTALAQMDADLAAMHAPHGLPAGSESYADVMRRRKYDSEFMAEMNRSVAWWMERWQSR